MHGASLEEKLNARLRRAFPGAGLRAELKQGAIHVRGALEEWTDIVKACRLCVCKDPRLHVVNDIEWLGGSPKPTRLPSARGEELEGLSVDVLVIGGGISGASIARELSRYELSVLVVEKESDLAMHASGHNDGEVHPGVDLPKGSLKQRYVVRGNRMFGKLCRELNVPFVRRGQLACFTSRLLLPAVALMVWQRRHVCGVSDTRLVNARFVRRREPGLNQKIAFAIYNPSAGCVSPYGLTIAYAENAVMNGAQLALNTAVLSMERRGSRIVSVETTQGRVYPRIVVNAAGVFAEEIAAMAGDRFYSIHPRRGTNSIMDKRAAAMLGGIVTMVQPRLKKAHSKGGGVMRTVEGTLLVGPNAEEIPDREDFATEESAIQSVLERQSQACPGLSRQDIIAYFSGIRAATFEEDYVLEWGRRAVNLFHCAGIQSPGLTTAPAVAVALAGKIRRRLEQLSGRKVAKKQNFVAERPGIPKLSSLSWEEREKKIYENPDYGEMICRCEEISKGEILDVLRSPICVPTIDAIKRRVRPGMGRCQGAFCMPLVARLISETTGLPLEQIQKDREGSVIAFASGKGEDDEKL